MSFVRAFGLVAVCSITSSAFAEESATNAEFRHVLARADVVTHVDTLESFSGSYRSAEGVAFYVVQDGDSLTIELPEGWDASESQLRADAAGGGVADATTVVKFETDIGGRVTGLVAYPASGRDAILAAKEPARRGIVTIVDVPANQVPRGIVTIQDVATDPDLTVAAN